MYFTEISPRDTAQTPDHPARLEQPLHRRDGLLCVLLTAACFMLAYPFVEMGFIDDWAYIKMAQVFAQTGHFAYNGWASVTLGWQIPWGALFSKLFGFSFVHVRLSTLPLALVSVYLFHQILTRFGLPRNYAIFGALALGVSPVFLLMSATYMTDLPGLFSTILCLYLCQRALTAPADRTALVWLCAAAVTNIFGGTVRQTAWLGVLLMVPSTAWLLRRQRYLLWSGALLWLTGVVSVAVLLHWFNHQPYFIPEKFFPEHLNAAVLKHMASQVFVQGSQVLFCLPVMVFPVLVMWLPLARSVPRRPLLWSAVISAVLLTGFLVYCHRQGRLQSGLAPWLGHVMGQMGIPGTDNIPGPKPGPLHNRYLLVITVLVLSSELIFLVHLLSRLRLAVRLRPAPMPVWRQIFGLLGPYTLGYLGALGIQATIAPLFDRYLLPLQAVGIIVLLRYYYDFVTGETKLSSFPRLAGRLPAVGYIALLAFAYYAVAGTHDWFALDRARLTAVEEIRHSGVPRTAIGGGFEYDGWTQLEVGGYTNDPRIRIPRNAFHPAPSLNLPPACTTWFSYSAIPAVVPQYFVVFEPLPCFAPSRFPPVTYRAWMPPFIRRVYVQQIRN